MLEKSRQFLWIGCFCLLVELHLEGSAINRAIPSSFFCPKVSISHHFKIQGSSLRVTDKRTDVFVVIVEGQFVFWWLHKSKKQLDAEQNLGIASWVIRKTIFKVLCQLLSKCIFCISLFIHHLHCQGMTEIYILFFFNNFWPK